jgi:hypothetical protein
MKDSRENHRDEQHDEGTREQANLKHRKITAVLWIRNYFFRIRIPFSDEFWIRIKKIVMDPDPDPTSKKFRIQFRIRP